MITVCPYCTLSYQQQHIRLLKRDAVQSLYHVHCAQCSHDMLVSIFKKKGGILCAGIFTDCVFEDAKRFLDGEKVSIDDVISVHKALKFDNFSKIV
jgi:hypothetical protein